MKYILLVFIGFLMVSCGNEKTIQLPEIGHSEITEIHDVSAAYLFYDETQKDSVEFNRKNLIGTTNWLVNVDKRLTLKQAIPHIKYLQNKRRNAQMHKNENAKNYFTCNDISRKNLGFIEFTDVVYHKESAIEYFSKISTIPKVSMLNVVFHSTNRIEIFGLIGKPGTINSNRYDLISDLKSVFQNNGEAFEVVLNFNQDLNFQDYITFKSILLRNDLSNLTTVKTEFIY